MFGKTLVKLECDNYQGNDCYWGRGFFFFFFGWQFLPLNSAHPAAASQCSPNPDPNVGVEVLVSVWAYRYRCKGTY